MTANGELSNVLNRFNDTTFYTNNTEISTTIFHTTNLISTTFTTIFDNDNKTWYDEWTDPLEYDIFQWVVLGVIVLILIVSGCAIIRCCCRRKNKLNEYQDPGDNFITNPTRYRPDSVFVGHEKTISPQQINMVSYEKELL